VTKQLDPIDFHRMERNAMEVNEDHLRTFMLLQYTPIFIWMF